MSSRSHEISNIRLKQIASNIAMVSIGAIDLYFSYETIVAFREDSEGFVVSENVWSMTTAKHLSKIDPQKKYRVPNDEFEERLHRTLRSLKLL